MEDRKLLQFIFLGSLLLLSKAWGDNEYRILGIDQTATELDISVALQRKMAQLDPTDPDFTKKQTELINAKKKLSDPMYRHKLNEKLTLLARQETARSEDSIPEEQVRESLIRQYGLRGEVSYEILSQMASQEIRGNLSKRHCEIARGLLAHAVENKLNIGDLKWWGHAATLYGYLQPNPVGNERGEYSSAAGRLITQLIKMYPGNSYDLDLKGKIYMWRYWFKHEPDSPEFRRQLLEMWKAVKDHFPKTSLRDFIATGHGSDWQMLEAMMDHMSPEEIFNAATPVDNKKEIAPIQKRILETTLTRSSNLAAQQANHYGRFWTKLRVAFSNDRCQRELAKIVREKASQNKK